MPCGDYSVVFAQADGSYAEQLDYFEVNVDKSSAEFAWIQKIVQKTTESVHTMNECVIAALSELLVDAV